MKYNNMNSVLVFCKNTTDENNAVSMNFLFDTVKGEKIKNLLVIPKMTIAVYISILFDNKKNDDRYFQIDTDYEFRIKIYSIKKNLGLNIGDFNLRVENRLVNSEKFYEYRGFLNLEDLIAEPGAGEYTISLYARKKEEKDWQKQTSHRLVVK